jgi:hypothetical protein
VNAAQFLDDAVAGLDERSVVILRERTFARTPAAVRALAPRLGVSAEEVRRLEDLAAAALRTTLHADPEFMLLLPSTRDRVGLVLPVRQLLRDAPDLARDVPTVGAPLWRVVQRLDGRWDVVDGWCVSGTAANAVRETRRLLHDHADTAGVLPLATAADLLRLPDDPADPHGLQAWLARLDAGTIAGHVVLRGRSQAARAEALLHLHRSPLSTAQIADAVGAATVPGMQRVLATHHPIARTDRAMWGLRRWGLPEYLGVRALIGHALDTAAGPVPLTDLTAALTAQYSITVASVRVTAATWPYRTIDGTVARDPHPDNPARRARTLRRFYLDGTQHHLRLTVTDALLRGSATHLPVGIAAALHVPAGGKRTLTTAEGPVALRWTGAQPNHGSLRHLLAAADAQPGQQVILTYRGDTLALRILPPLPDDPLHAACLLCGLDPAAPDRPGRISAALGLPTDAPAADVVAHCQHRGETDLARAVAAGSGVELAEGARQRRGRGLSAHLGEGTGGEAPGQGRRGRGR